MKVRAVWMWLTARILSHHLGGDDGGQSVGVLTQRASTLLCANEVVQQQHTSLVAGENLELTLGVAYHHAHSVGVRVGCPR